MSTSTTPRADWFDGRSARARPVRLQRAGRELLLLDAAEDAAPDAPPLLRVPLADVQWPERTRHGARVAHLKPVGELHARDAAAWDAFVAASGVRESLAVRSQQSWRAVLVAALLLLALAAAGWRWGIPLAAEATLAVLPPSADREVGALALAQIEEEWLQPSTLPRAQQEALRAAFARALAAAHGTQQAEWRLEFRAAKDIGPNAFALPGGHIVITDELVQLVGGDEAAVVGVLAHEYGHVRQRHGMRQLVQAGLLGAATGVAFGDFSGWLAALPALLGTLAYSRDLEREADDEAVHVLRAAGLPSEAMLRFFDAAAAWRREHVGDLEAGLGIAFSSHPADEERKARFRAAAR